MEKSLTVENLSKWKSFLNRGFLDIKIPKFKLETEYNLKNILQKSGTSDAFTSADFSGIGDDELYISKATHRTFVDISEEGTNTDNVYNQNKNQHSTEKIYFHADHPFILIIQDNETDNILFMGRITNPQ